jgi:hypothetical protein
MSDKIKIRYNKNKILDSIESNQLINVIVILLIIKHSINGNAKSISLNKLAFIFDAINKDKNVKKGDVFLSKPWHISSNLRKLIIVGHELGLLKIEKAANRVKFSLDEKGENLYKTIENDQLFIDLEQDIKLMSEEVKEADLSNQNLIW